MPFVRAALPDDAPLIADIHSGAWRHRYPEWPPSIWRELATPEIVESWRNDIANPPTAAHRVLVAFEDDGRVCGFAALEPGFDEELVAHACIGIFEVAPSHRQRGHGSRLMSAAVEYALADGALGLTVWLDQGSPASRFLADSGWGPRGVRRTLEISDGIRLQQHEWWTTIRGDSSPTPADTVSA